MSPASPRLILQAHAKINLSLRILGKRDDGFHGLQTRMVTIGIADEVTVERLAVGTTRLTCSDVAIPTDESNLALKALRAFERRTGSEHSWAIHLEKHVPSGAGLGGGSSNAATALRAVNQLSGSPLPHDELLKLAAGIGSDVPFFLLNGAADASGRGEIVVPVAIPNALSVVLIKPPFGISTPWAYKRWAESKPLEGIRYDAQPSNWGDMVNDLERPVFEKHLMLASLKMWLLDQPETQSALMSGSGSTMFAVVREGHDSQALAQRAQDWCGASFWVRVTTTVTG